MMWVVLFIVGCNMTECVWSWNFLMWVWYRIMASTEQVLFCEFSVVGKYWFTDVLRDLDIGLKMLFWCYKLGFLVDFDKMFDFQGFERFFWWFSGDFWWCEKWEMVDFVGVCRSGYRSKNGEKCAGVGRMENVCDVWVTCGWNTWPWF